MSSDSTPIPDKILLTRNRYHKRFCHIYIYMYIKCVCVRACTRSCACVSLGFYPYSGDGTQNPISLATKIENTATDILRFARARACVCVCEFMYT